MNIALIVGNNLEYKTFATYDDQVDNNVFLEEKGDNYEITVNDHTDVVEKANLIDYLNSLLSPDGVFSNELFSHSDGIHMTNTHEHFDNITITGDFAILFKNYELIEKIVVIDESKIKHESSKCNSKNINSKIIDCNFNNVFWYFTCQSFDGSKYILSRKKYGMEEKFPLNFTDEYQYLNLVNSILQNGVIKNTRNGETLSVFSPSSLKFDLRNGLPILTTKKMFVRGIFEELIMFINGITDSKYLEEKGVKIWTNDTSADRLKQLKLNYREGDMGPMYGWNWRHFGAEYKPVDSVQADAGGFDQLEQLIQTIRTDPSSRRLLLTSLDPSKVHQAVLPPCHSLPIQFNVEPPFIDCNMYQRSADVFLGLPFNIASTSLLLSFIASLTNYTPRYVNILLGDTHIYTSHIPMCQEQLSRNPYKFPKLLIKKELNTLNDLETMQFSDIEITNYTSHAKIAAQCY